MNNFWLKGRMPAFGVLGVNGRNVLWLVWPTRTRPDFNDDEDLATVHRHLVEDFIAALMFYRQANKKGLEFYSKKVSHNAEKFVVTNIFSTVLSPIILGRFLKILLIFK